MSSRVFQDHLERKFKQDFHEIQIDEDLFDIFSHTRQYICIDTYIKLLSLIDMIDFENFQRYFNIVIRKYVDEDHNYVSLYDLKSQPLLQLLCIFCIQYYFS
jgi:hypothetical protein